MNTSLYVWALGRSVHAPTVGWHERARCAGRGTVMFYAGGQPPRHVLDVCAACPVRRDCLRDAHSFEAGQPVTHVTGVRGGLGAAARVRGYRSIPGGRVLQPCGTVAAHARHVAAGEEPCEACREARRVFDRQYLERRKAARRARATPQLKEAS